MLVDTRGNLLTRQRTYFNVSGEHSFSCGGRAGNSKKKVFEMFHLAVIQKILCSKILPNMVIPFSIGEIHVGLGFRGEVWQYTVEQGFYDDVMQHRRCT